MCNGIMLVIVFAHCQQIHQTEWICAPVVVQVKLNLVPNSVFDESKSKSLKAGGLQMVPNAVFESSKGEITDTDDFANQGGGGIKVRVPYVCIRHAKCMVFAHV